MTLPTAPLNPAPRPSASFAFRLAETIGGTLVNLLVGAALFVPGLLTYLSEQQYNYACDEPLHKGHLAIAVGLMVAGAVVVKPTFGKTITNFFVTVAPYLPMIGGKRAGDPPASTGEEK
jgi:hypothetical protein